MYVDQAEAEELSETIKHFEQKLSSETEEKTVYRNLVERLLEGFDNSNIS